MTWIHRDASRLSIRVVTVVVLALGASSCNELMFPCESSIHDDKFHPQRQRFMDGEWNLVSIDNKAIPATGFVLPSGGGVLTRGQLSFYTFRLEKGGCETGSDEQTQSSGEVIALYNLKSSNGTAQPARTQVGSFEYDSQSKVLVLRALGHSANATATLGVPYFGNGTMTLIGPIPVNDDEQVYTMVFQRGGSL